jgi:hypothetical protein
MGFNLENINSEAKCVKMKAAVVAYFGCIVYICSFVFVAP